MEDNEKINGQISTEIKTATRTSLFQRLASRFGFAAVPNTSDTSKKNGAVVSNFKLINKPTQIQLTGKTPKEELELVSSLVADSHLTSTVQELYDEWAEDTQNTYANVQERMERLNALTYMCDNEGIVRSAATLTASEVAALSDNCAFTAISEDKKWEDEINYALKHLWKYDQPTVYGLAWNLFVYGEAFQAREISSAGVIKLNMVRPTEIAERLEFKPSEVANYKMEAAAGTGGRSTGFMINLTNPTNGTQSNTNLSFAAKNNQVTYKSTDSLLKDYIDNITDISATEFYTSHLLGYRMFGDMLIAPWQVIHYRFNADVSEFWPYGQPTLLPCLSAYKSLQRAMGLDDLEKLLSLPMKMYKVKTNGVSATRAFDLVQMVKSRFENVGLVSTAAGLEGPSLCTNIWTAEDLVTVETVESGRANESGSTEKLKFFRDRLATSTGIPLNYLDPTSEGFQMSGVALTTLFRPFRTLVESIRKIIQTEVEDTIRLHDSIRGVQTPDFVLAMNTSNSVATEDTESKLTLADNVIEAIAGLLGTDKEALPRGIKKDVLMKYVGLTAAELDSYISTFEEEGAQVSAEPAEGEEEAEEEDMLESEYRSKVKQLIQERYRVASQGTDMLYYLTEKLGEVKTNKCTYRFNEGVNSDINADIVNFLKTRPKRNSRGKKRLRS